MSAQSKIRNAFTVDVEESFQVAAFDSVINPNDWERFSPRVVSNTDRLLDILAEHDISATFFILGWIAKRHPRLVAKIAEQGHEIACHGYSHSKIYLQDIDSFRNETRKAKNVIEQACGARIDGYRAASFSITQESIWALDVLAEEGFTYDSSVFPVRHDNYGMPKSPMHIHEIELQNGLSIVELPLNTIRLAQINIPVGGGGYFRLYPYGVTHWGLSRINKENRPFIFYMHPWELDRDQPRIKASLLSTFRHYNNLNRFEDRLERLASDFEFTTCKDVLREEGFVSANKEFE